MSATVLRPETATIPGQTDIVRRLLRDVVPPWLLSRLLLLAITLLFAGQPHTGWRGTVLAAVLPDPPRYYSPTPAVGGPLLTAWYHWDAAWYLRIAGNGPDMGYSHYTENPDHNFSATAFFPLYPVVVRGVALFIPGALATVPHGGTVRPGLIVAGLIVANSAFVLALIALYLLVHGRAGTAAARRAVWLLCVFPTTVFFSAPYSESLFLLCLVLFFFALDRCWWWPAGLYGALAAATRSLGAALVLPYLAAWWQAGRQHECGRGRLSTVVRLVPVLVIPLGLVAYMAYLQGAFGDALLFQKAERAWSRSLAWPWVGIVDGLTWSLRAWPHLPQPHWRGLTDALYAIVFLLLTALAWRGIDWPGRVYAAVFWLYVLCEPQISHPDHPDTLISMPRFLLVLLPLWIWLARSRTRTLLVAIPSAILLLAYATRWVNGGWIG